MAAYEEKTGSDVLAIAHNGNLEQRPHVPDHRVLHRQAGRSRVCARPARSWERLYEATQIKGDGEAHPFLSPNDEFADFETLGQGQPRPQRGQEAGDAASSSMPARRSRTASSSKQQLGVNPYKFGMVGSTDAHTGLAAVEEDNFFGKTSSSEPSPERAARTRSSSVADGDHHGLGDLRLGLRRGVGDGEHARGASSTRCSAGRPTPPPARA